MQNQDYHNRANYETFIMRAFKSKGTVRDVVMRSAYLNLLSIRDGISFKKENIESQFGIVKKYLIQALSKFLKTRLSAVEKVTIKQLIEETDDAIYIEQIDGILKRALEITIRYKP